MCKTAKVKSVSKKGKNPEKKLHKTTQLTFTCSNLTKETLEQGKNMFRVNNKDIRKTALALFWCLYC